MALAEVDAAAKLKAEAERKGKRKQKAVLAKKKDPFCCNIHAEQLARIESQHFAAMHVLDKLSAEVFAMQRLVGAALGKMSHLESELSRLLANEATAYEKIKLWSERTHGRLDELNAHMVKLPPAKAQSLTVTLGG